jgi:LysR family transcriptional regulator (chromosome initiation inhibitor)
MDVSSEQLRTLATVVSAGTFEAAAAALNVTPSAVSQRIRQLERSAGTVLIRRTKPAGTTAAGDVLLRLARQFESLSSDAALELRGPGGGPGVARARVAVAVNADSLSTWFGGVLAELATDSALELEVMREDERISAEHLRTGRVMAAVTTSDRPVQGCVSAFLGTLTYRAMATPAFAATWFGSNRGSGDHPLRGAPVVHYDRSDGLQWDLIRGVAGADADPPSHYVPDSELFVRAVAAGLGWGMVPTGQAPTDGTLVTIDPAFSRPVRLYWQRWKIETPALARVSDAVSRAASEWLGEN